ncbi:Mce protein [Mycobacterium sp. 852002-40037_SCH5390672]|uniref:Mce protein n=1 Tax=Mycobacterium sp. 852002-40037_SCH5390672 TaxID=1834089 RepID=UPI000804FFF2|nr:Mce protein [Mycobacterium sp. 852002-40037_SCH5390672]OBB94742.1 Mce protein [Mycobacterium sp. 852002-40037_SCH5390672]
MEGDAGTSRLNPIDTDDSLTTQDKNEDSAAPENGAEQTRPQDASEDPVDSTDGAADVHADAGQSESDGAADHAESGEPAVAVPRGPSRVGRGWLAAIAAVLALCAGGIGAGGYLALHYHHESQQIARNDAAALKAAVECVSATQAPDTNAMTASEQKIIDCGTDAFRSQALLYTSMLVQAYQAANIHVQVADVRGAVERNNRDGSIDILVALRVKVANDQTQNETGYRLRVKMAFAEGQYKISKLDQVTK